MTWQAERRPASFRGLEFEAETLGHSGGNALVVDHLPESDDHTVGELGNEPDAFSLRGFVSGDDYLDQLGNLEAAFRKRGAGELVHPWRGHRFVFVKTWSITHDIGGGVGEFEIECVPAGLETRPTVLVVTETDVIDKGDAAKTAAAARLALFDTDGPTFFGTVAGAIDYLNEIPSYYAAALALAQTGELTAFELATGRTVDAPAELAGLLAAVESACGSSTLQGLMRYLSGASTTDLPTGATAPAEGVRESAAAYAGLVRTVSIAAACSLAVDESYTSADAAEDQQAALVAVIDVALDLEPDDDTFTSLSDLRAALVSAMSEIASRLPRLRTISIASPTPALVLSFDFYGNTDREDEILELNQALHPGFLAGTLTVLT